MKKHVCYKCKNEAVWMYAPASNHVTELQRYFCDVCVPTRGCSCQDIKDIDEHGNIIVVETPVDDFYRPLPCVEYWYDDDGFEVDRK